MQPRALVHVGHDLTVSGWFPGGKPHTDQRVCSISFQVARSRRSLKKTGRRPAKLLGCVIRARLTRGTSPRSPKVSCPMRTAIVQST
eukprot:5388343-Heterocapsa_arctica.AAC.1